MQKSPTPGRAFFWALLVSLLFIHLPLMIYLVRTAARSYDRTALKSHQNVIKIDLKKMPLKVADISPPQNQNIPDNPSAQALYNSTVKEETVSPTSRPQQTTGTTPRKNQSSSSQTSKSPSSTSKSTATSSSQSQSRSSSSSVSTSSSLISSSTDLASQFNQIRNERTSKEDQRLRELFSSKTMSQLPTSLGGAPSNPGEFFPNYKIGNRTYLNTLANPGIFYFVELRRKFRLAFNPLPALRASISKLPKNKIEVVWGVSLDSKGVLNELVLLKSSGLAIYDAEGRRTVSSSAPFTAPPANLLDSEGRLNMAWTFTVYY